MSNDAYSAGPIGFDLFGDWFRRVFQLWSAQWQVWVLQGLIYNAACLLAGLLFRRPVASIGGFVIFALLGPGMVRTALKQIRGETIAVGDIFSEVGCFLGALVICLVAALGLVACVIGVFVTGGLTMLALPALVDRKMPVGDAINLSWRLTMRSPFFYIMFCLVMGLLSISGLLVCGIGIIATTAFATIAAAVAYEETMRFASRAENPSVE